jgi:hypothetical protein
MAAILTAEDVVPRIAAECAYVDERGGVGIRLEPAAAIVRQLGSNSAGRLAADNRGAHRSHRLCSDFAMSFGHIFCNE